MQRVASNQDDQCDESLKCFLTHLSFSIESAIIYKISFPIIKSALIRVINSSQSYGNTHTLFCNFKKPILCNVILNLFRATLFVSRISKMITLHLPSHFFGFLSLKSLRSISLIVLSPSFVNLKNVPFSDFSQTIKPLSVSLLIAVFTLDFLLPFFCGSRCFKSESIFGATAATLKTPTMYN